MSETGVFSKLSDDIVLSIIYKLDHDPRDWARLACVSTKFTFLIRTICFRAKCSQSIPAVVSDLLPSTAAAPPAGWGSLYRIAVCCPGLFHSGVLLGNSGSGLEPQSRLDEDSQENRLSQSSESQKSASKSDTSNESSVSGSDCTWSFFDDLSFDSSYNDSGTLSKERAEVQPEVRVSKRRKICRSHLASRIWNLSREQGNKLLASRFKGDCLYICDWPGCVHIEKKRNYMLFRGIFKDFKQSRVWRTINDVNKNKIDLNCMFCNSKQAWDLHSSYCLRRAFGYHEDGEPVVRAYVCENGHVSGAWTNWPLYT